MHGTKQWNPKLLYRNQSDIYFLYLQWTGRGRIGDLGERAMQSAVMVSGNGTARVRDGLVMEHLAPATTPVVRTALYNATVTYFLISIKIKYLHPHPAGVSPISD